MGNKIQILYIDNDARDRALVKDSLEKEHGGFTLTLTKSKEEFETLIHQKKYDLVLSDFNILGFEGFQVLKTVQSVSPETPVIIVTGTGSEEVAVKALKMGASDYIIKSPQHILRLPNTIQATLEKNRLIQEREIDRKKLLKMNRVYSLISQVNQLIVRTHNREALLQEACNIAIAYGKFRMAWIGLNNENSQTLSPHCWAGYEKGYFKTTQIKKTDNVPEGQGPTGRALREGKYIVCNDIEHDPVFEPWRNEALKRNYLSSITLPIMLGEDVIGVYNIYADEPHFFDSQEIKLLEEVVGDISFALEGIKAEEIRRENEKELQAYFEHDISADFLVSFDGKLINCNKTFYKMFGIESEAQKEKFNITRLYKNPDERKELLAEVKKKGKVENYEINLIKADGTPLYVMGNILGNFDDAGELTSLREYTVDITKRRLAEELLVKLSRAVEQSPETIIITDKDGKIEYVNPTFTKVTGYTFKEVQGQNPKILSSQEKSKNEYKKLWNTILSGKVWRGEFHDKKKNGELYWEQASISPIINEKGEITHFVAVKEDITERKAKDLELKMALEKARESDKLKSAFLANMSHEIRTPMNGILGFAELLKEPLDDGEQQKEYLGIIEKSAHRMLSIITDIVNISKIEAGQMDIFITEADLNGEIDYLFSFFKPEAGLKNVKLTCSKGLNDAEAIIKTDREKLSSILTNLIKNAIKFTSKGSIDMGYEKKRNFLEFYIKDTGEGISEKNKDIVFERFRQGSDSLTKGYEGSGLGLSISKAYVEMLGGKIWFKSKKEGSPDEKGTEFRFTIPYHSVFLDPAKDDKEKLTPDKSLKNKKYNILIVEDDDVSEKLLRFILDPISNKIHHAPTGKKALEITKQNPDIDFILMDIRMPIMNGYEATREIRKFNKDVIIIAQTAFAMEGDREMALEAGCNDYITKPIQLDKFRVLLKKFNLE